MWSIRDRYLSCPNCHGVCTDERLMAHNPIPNEFDEAFCPMCGELTVLYKWETEDKILYEWKEGGGEEDESNAQEIIQEIEQEVDQEVDQSEENEQDNDNTQTQVGAIDQDIAQGIEDGDDTAESSSESGDASGRDSSSSATSGDAENSNEQEAANDAVLTQEQFQEVTQTNEVEFGDDTAILEGTNVAIPIAVPINVQLEEEDQPPVEEPEGDVEWCYDYRIDTTVQSVCYTNEQACESDRALDEREVISDSCYQRPS